MCTHTVPVSSKGQGKVTTGVQGKDRKAWTSGCPFFRSLRHLLCPVLWGVTVTKYQRPWNLESKEANSTPDFDGQPVSKTWHHFDQLWVPVLTVIHCFNSSLMIYMVNHLSSEEENATCFMGTVPSSASVELCRMTELFRRLRTFLDSHSWHITVLTSLSRKSA